VTFALVIVESANADRDWQSRSHAGSGKVWRMLHVIFQETTITFKVQYCVETVS
jgi:hypothetical protein